jgi:hypothetical protein
MLLLILSAQASFLDDSGQVFAPAEVRAVVMTDYDNDGDLDVLMGRLSSGVQILSNELGMLTPMGTFGTTTTHDIELVDINNDSTLDAILCDWQGGAEVYTLEFGGNYIHRQTVGGQPCWAAGTSDFNSDGFPDFVLSNRGSANVFLGVGGGLVSAGAPVTAGGDWFDVAVGDLDGDFDDDLWFGTDGRQEAWLNDGLAHFTRGQVFTGYRQRKAEIADLDGDGDQDIFASTDNSGTAKVYLNNGLGTFTDTLQSLPVVSGWGVTLADWDLDGDPDAFTGEMSAPDRLWLNDGAGSFSDAGTIDDHGETLASAAGDLNNDGLPDLFLGTWLGPETLWFNDGTAGQSVASFELTRQGTCPGTTVLSVSGGTPGGVLWGASSPVTGAAAIPTGPCAGLNTGLGMPVTLRVNTTVSGAGTWSGSFQLPAAACGQKVVFVDAATCARTVVTTL